MVKRNCLCMRHLTAGVAVFGMLVVSAGVSVGAPLPKQIVDPGTMEQESPGFSGNVNGVLPIIYNDGSSRANSAGTGVTTFVFKNSLADFGSGAFFNPGPNTNVDPVGTGNTNVGAYLADEIADLGNGFEAGDSITSYELLLFRSTRDPDLNPGTVTFEMWDGDPMGLLDTVGTGGFLNQPIPGTKCVFSNVPQGARGIFHCDLATPAVITRERIWVVLTSEGCRIGWIASFLTPTVGAIDVGLDGWLQIEDAGFVGTCCDNGAICDENVSETCLDAGGGSLANSCTDGEAENITLFWFGGPCGISVAADLCASFYMNVFAEANMVASWQPVGTAPFDVSSGTTPVVDAVIVGNEIILERGGGQVFLDLGLTTWNFDGNDLGMQAYQITLDCSGYTSGLRGSLSTVLIPCDPAGDSSECGVFGKQCSITGGPCDTNADCVLGGLEDCLTTAVCEFPPTAPQFCAPGHIFTGRANWIMFKATGPNPAVSMATCDFQFGAIDFGSGVKASQYDAAIIAANNWYGGTLALEVSSDAAGTFTLSFLNPPATLVSDVNGGFFPLIGFEPGFITVTTGQCCNLDQPLCLGGEFHDEKCVDDTDCRAICVDGDTPGADCDPAAPDCGAICVGGADDGNTCDPAASACAAIITDGICDVGVTDLCIGGATDGDACVDDGDCVGTPSVCAPGTCPDAGVCRTELPFCLGAGFTVDECTAAGVAFMATTIFDSTKICPDDNDPNNPNACVECVDDAGCDDGDACTVDTCCSATQLAAGSCDGDGNGANFCNVTTDVDCSDGLFCTDDVCDSGNAATPCSNPDIDIDDSDGCTDDFCCEGADRVPPEVDDIACADGGAGGAVAVNEVINVVRVTDDGDDCTIDKCDSSTGLITHDVINELGLACNTGIDCLLLTGGLTDVCIAPDPNDLTSPCMSAKCCDCSLCIPIVAEVQGGMCFFGGEKVVVEVIAGSTTKKVMGAQFILTWDPSCLALGQITPSASFPFELANIPDRANGRAFYAAGVDPFSGGSVSGFMLLASAQFTKIGDCNHCKVGITGDNPQDLRFTVLNDQFGSQPLCAEVLPDAELWSPQRITIDGPGNMDDINSDCDANTAIVTWDMPTASGSCGPVDLDCVGMHDSGLDMTALAFGGGEHPQGVTSYWCTASDPTTGACTVGDVEHHWTVTVSDMQSLDLTVQLEPLIAGDVHRCIQFELFADCASTAVPFEQDLWFGGLFDFVGHFTDKKKIPKGQYSCITARDQLHTLRASAAITCRADGNYEAIFKGDPFLGGNWLKGGNLDAFKKNNPDASHNVIDILDFGMFVATFGTCPGPDTLCGTPGPHADINGDGCVDELDFPFISRNFGMSSKNACCAGSGAAGEFTPLTSVTLRELRQMGFGELSVADLNNDGVLDLSDMDAFSSGVLPVKKIRAPRGKGSGLRR